MADVFLDPRLPDYVDEIDISREAARAGESFLASRLPLLRGVDLSDIDMPFLQKIAFPQTWEMKKFQFRDFLRDYTKRGAHAALYEPIFAACGDRRRFDRLLKQFDAIGRLADDVLRRVFPDASIGPTGYVARFSETRMENLHYDIDADSAGHEAVRLYINVDSAPRIWATSYQLTDLAPRVAGRVNAERYRDQPLEAFVKQMTGRAFGGWHNRADERASPRHLVYFEPGDVWIVDGRSLAHQVLFGQRVISIYARLPYAENPALTPSFRDKAKAAIESAAAPPQAGVEQIALKGPAVSAGDIKANWADVFGKPEGGRVRKFTAHGEAT